GNLLRCGLLDDVALHEVDELAIAQDGDGRRTGRIVFEVAARAIASFSVLAGKNGDLAIGPVLGIGQRQTHARAHSARSASTNGVDDDHRCSGLIHGRFNVFGGAGFLNAGAGQFLAHGDHHDFWIHAALPPAGVLPDSILAERHWCSLEPMIVKENEPLAPLTTLNVGGAARWFAEAASERSEE